MPYSPLGIFVGLSQSELDALRSAAISAFTNGQRISISGGQKSGTKRWQDPKETLAEVVYAEQQNGTRAPRAQKVYQTMNDQFSHRRTE